MSAELRRPSEFLPAAGWIELSGRAQLRLTGRDRATFLHNFCSNDIKRLQPGQGCEAFVTNVKGRIVGHVHVSAEADSLVLESASGSAETLVRHLDRYIITEDVQIADETLGLAAFYVFGHESADPVRQVTHCDATRLGRWEHFQGMIGDDRVAVRRIDFTQAPGFEIVGPLSAKAVILQRLRESDCLPVTAADAEAFRIDAGFPRSGVDLTEDHLAQEASRNANAISFTKGCYLGQEPIARIDALGHVNRLLRIVVFERGVSLAVGDRVSDPESGNELGVLTSVGGLAESATVGLAVVRTSAGPGAEVVAGPNRATGRVVAID